MTKGKYSVLRGGFRYLPDDTSLAFVVNVFDGEYIYIYIYIYLFFCDILYIYICVCVCIYVYICMYNGNEFSYRLTFQS